MKTSPDASEKDGYKMNCKDDCKCKGCRKKAMREESVEKTWSEEARKKAAETRKRKGKQTWTPSPGSRSTAGRADKSKMAKRKAAATAARRDMMRKSNKAKR